MNLRALAEQDLGVTLEDKITGFAVDVTVIDPDGLEKILSGTPNDIAFVIDPDTGQAVTGRFAKVTLRISSLTAAGFTSLPVGVPDSTSKPWVIKFKDVNDIDHVFKVESSLPDRTLGVISLTLENYTELPP